MNPEVIINKLEYKVNELTFRNKDLERLGDIKDRLHETYRSELIKELLSLYLNNKKISITGDITRGNREIAQLRLNRDLAKIEVLRSILTLIRNEF